MFWTCYIFDKVEDVKKNMLSLTENTFLLARFDALLKKFHCPQKVIVAPHETTVEKNSILSPLPALQLKRIILVLSDAIGCSLSLIL